MKCSEVIVSYPLTDIQKGLLFEVALSNYSTPIYIVQNSFEIQDEFDISFFVKAFNIILNRHEILRSAIIQNGTNYEQVIYSNVEIPFEFFDYTEFTSEEKSKYFYSFLESDLQRSIDLSISPLMRLTFFKFSDKHFRFVWTRHHVLMDGASAEIIIDELFTVYHALLKQVNYVLSDPIPYELISSIKEKQSEQLAKKYWSSIIRQTTDIAFLPLLPAGNNKIKKIECKKVRIDEIDYSRLVNFVSQHALTINTILQGALGIVLSHYSDKEEIIFGSVRAYPKEKVKNSIGLFINTLPVYLEVKPSSEIIEYLQAIRQQNKLIKKYITTPLSKIKDWCGFSHDAPIFQCVIDYKPRSLNSVLKKHFPLSICNTSIKLDIPYPIVFEIVNETDSLQVNLHYDSQCFEESYMAIFLEHFKNILIRLISDEVMYLAELQPLTNLELAKLMDWNKTIKPYPIHKTIHQLFEEQVEKTPSAIAVCYEGRALTYQALNMQANQLAHYLIQQNVGAETPIAICVKPTLNIIVAILAVLKAGGIYIPIDVQYPVERIQYILLDSQPKVIITESEKFELFSQITATQEKFNPIFINMNEVKWRNFVETNPRLPIKSSSGMYIIYTSGSTGLPKGVILEHHSAVNTAFACIEKLQVNSQSRILQISSISFDVFVAEWTMALLSGAGIYLINKDVFSPEAIVKALRVYRITTIILASSILAALPRENLPDLKVIAPGGEYCGNSVVDFWAKNRLFINVYGITEAAICSTMANLSVEYPRISNIGRPLPNTQVYILDRNLKPVPIGVTGQIYLGGEGLARGYVNNLKLSQERFIFHTFNFNSKNITIRLYKTGDYGRWLVSGSIEYLGRQDEQIKIRGFRIELFEIEQTLEKYPAVKNAAVAVNDTPIGKQLYAYISPIKKRLDINKLRAFIQTKLPNYMIPANFFQLEELPLTPNGKIDKQKLLTLKFDDQVNEVNTSTIFVSDLEETFKKVAQALLQRNDIALDVNFLELGFESLSLVQFSNYLSQVLGKKVNVLDLFTYPTIKSLSAYIGKQINTDITINVKHQPGTAKRSNRIIFTDER